MLGRPEPFLWKPTHRNSAVAWFSASHARKSAGVWKKMGSMSVSDGAESWGGYPSRVARPGGSGFTVEFSKVLLRSQLRERLRDILGRSPDEPAHDLAVAHEHERRPELDPEGAAEALSPAVLDRDVLHV